MANEIDLVIAGGWVVDGTGSAAWRADVGVSSGRIVAIGDGDVPPAARILDASGCVVAPGFIDIHTHYDAQVFWDPWLSPSSFHGVTTVVTGNCGFSLAPTRAQDRKRILSVLASVEDMNLASLNAGLDWDFESFPEYLSSIARRRPAINVGAFVGLTPLRLFALGEEAYERPATGRELDDLSDLVADAISAGAVGLSTSCSPFHRDTEGRPVPSRAADRAEIMRLAGVLRAAGRGVVQVSPGGDFTANELYPLQVASGVPFTFGALLSREDGTHRELVRINRQSWDEGAQVWPQVTSRPVTVEFDLGHPAALFTPNPAFAELIGSSDEDRRGAYADPVWRERAAKGFEMPERSRPRWETFEITRSSNRPDLVGLRLEELARSRRTSPLNTLLDLALEDDLSTGVRAVVANDDAEEVDDLLREDHCVLGLSDAGAHLTQLCDAPQATDFLARVRDRKVMPLEQAVRKLTGAQADLLRIADRGYLRPGMRADIVVFDPTAIAPGPLSTVRDFPAGAERLTAEEPAGVSHVIVNGTPIRVGEQQLTDSADRPGHVLTASSFR